MPVDRATFDAVRQRVIQTAPSGLSKQQFDALLDQELAKVEQPPAAASRGMVPQSTVQGDPKASLAQNDPGARPATFANVMLASPTGQATHIAPAIGGAVGGVVGGPLGAAVGGATGDIVRQAGQSLRTDAPAMTSTERAESVVKEGVIQGALQGTGQALAWGGGKLAKWLMNRATTRVTAQLAREFPDLSDTLIDKALTVSKGGEAKARMLLKVAKGKATAALDVAEQAGATIPAQFTPEVAEVYKVALIEQAIKSGQLPPGVSVASARLPAALQQTIQAIETAAQNGTPVNLGPKAADMLKTALQKHARAVYLNRVAPNGPKAMSLGATEAADYATQLNAAIDAVATGYKAANAEAQPLIGAARGLKQAIRPSGNLYQAMVRPAVGAALGSEAGRREGGTTGQIVGGIAGAAMTSPAGMSREAILLAHPAMQALLKQMPRATATALTAFLQSQGSQPMPAHSAAEQR